MHEQGLLSKRWIGGMSDGYIKYGGESRRIDGQDRDRCLMEMSLHTVCLVEIWLRISFNSISIGVGICCCRGHKVK